MTAELKMDVHLVRIYMAELSAPYFFFTCFLFAYFLSVDQISLTNAISFLLNLEILLNFEKRQDEIILSRVIAPEKKEIMYTIYISLIPDKSLYQLACLSDGS